MIISHKYKYVFVQLDQTASTAIAKELCENYCGQEILWKHARYCDFLKVAKPFEKKYYAFSGVRNPLDVVVSLYFKHKYRPKYFDIKLPETRRHNFKQAMYIKDNNATFTEYLKKFYSKRIYAEWKNRDFFMLDRIYRFERLQEDFSSILKDLSIAQVRPLPIVNKTEERAGDFFHYYDTAEARQLAQTVFKDEMEEWDYRFPKDWERPNLYCRIKYFWLKILYAVRKIIYSAICNTGFYRKFVIKNEELMIK